VILEVDVEEELLGLEDDQDHQLHVLLDRSQGAVHDVMIEPTALRAVLVVL